MGRQESVRQIRWIARKVGLDRAQRRHLHALITKQALTLLEIEALARELVRGSRRARRERRSE
ncbi:MAG: hypothetical protein KIT58_01185 [Planctomycetota bacterium]|nr:hypothetical protein [Planctomycetota bacterium]